MSAVRSWLGTVDVRELRIAAVAAAATAAIALIGSTKLHGAELLAPLAVVLAAILMRRAAVMVTLVTGLVIVCEGPSFGFLHFTSHLYDQFYKGLTPLDVLVALAIVSVGWELVRERRSFVIPRTLALPLTFLGLAMVAGMVTGTAKGASTRSVLLGEHVLTYLLLLPLAVVNLRVERRKLVLLIGALALLAVGKAVAGLIEVAGHYGTTIEGHSTLTYYEPAANWLIMVVMFGGLAMALAHQRLPRWLLLGSPLLIASLVLSYRRSFWIAAGLGVILLVTLGVGRFGRRMLVPVAIILAIGGWLAVSSVNFETSSSPILRRIGTLTPERLEANAEARYRINERENVLAEIGEHPLTGLGMEIPWSANHATLSVEHPEGRLYVHFAALWFWLKLGILGVFAYLSILIAGMVMALRVWRRSRAPAIRAFGLASLCALLTLVPIEMTASFTGIDARFTVLLAVQLGILALLDRGREGGEPESGPASEDGRARQREDYGFPASRDSTVVV